MDQSIDKTITAVVGYCKNILRVEQKKNDFMSEDLSSLNQGCTHACRKVVDYLTRCIGQMKGALDGENIEIILAEFGSRFHGLIFEHLQQFQYSSMGGMLVICDIKVSFYRVCVAYITVITHCYCSNANYIVVSVIFGDTQTILTYSLTVGIMFVAKICPKQNLT